MLRQLGPAFRMTLLLTIITGLIYPAMITGMCQTLFHWKANGSLVEKNGRLIGSALIGQSFKRPEYFHGRPSAAGSTGYDASASSGSNLGPTSRKLFDQVKESADDFRRDNPGYQGPIPTDAVAASASGLDPDISLANGAAQAERVAKARGVQTAQVHSVISSLKHNRDLGLLGEPRINVLTLNLALDQSFPNQSRRER